MAHDALFTDLKCDRLHLGGTQLTATAAQLNSVAAGTPAAEAIDDLTLVFTSNAPAAADGSVTIADGDTIASAETSEAIKELTAKLNLILAALRAFGVIAESEA